MSGLGDFFMGSQGEPGRVVDVTPEAYRRLQSPIAQALMRMMSNPAQWEGPFAAGMTDAERRMLGQVEDFEASEEFQRQTLERLGNLPQGFQREALQRLREGPQTDLINKTLQGDFLTPESNPFLQAHIEAAQRPLLERFEQQMGSKRGEFTQAGHFVQPGSSSPFETAKAREQTGLANAMADIGTKMAAQNYARERQAQENAIAQFMRNEQLGSGIESGLSQQIIQSGEVGSGIEAGMGQRRLQNLLSRLEAQALPRMIEQMGIDRGMQEFQRQQQQLMQLISMGGELGTPITATFQPTGGSPGAAHGLFGGLGQGLGSGLGAMMTDGGGDGGGLGGMFSGLFGGGGGGGAAAGGAGAGLASGAAGGGSGSGIAGAGAGVGAAGAGGGGASGGASGGGALASAGPWAALAALILGNETYAADQGYRSDDTMTHLRDALTGRVVYQDMDQRFIPMVHSDDSEFGQDLRSMYAFSGFDWDNTVRHGQQGLLSGFWDLFG